MFLDKPISIKVNDVNIRDALTILEGLSHHLVLSKVTIKQRSLKFKGGSS
jgi:hypothetical protein